MSDNIEKPASGLKISRSTTLWVFVGLALSSSIVIAISFLSGVTLSDFEQFGFVPFVLAGLVSSCPAVGPGPQVSRCSLWTFGSA